MYRKSSIFILLLGIQGCAAPAIVTAVGVTSIAVNETTGKSLTDHVVSTAKEKDCRISRWFKGEEVCLNTETPQIGHSIAKPDGSSIIDSYEEVLATRRGGTVK